MFGQVSFVDSQDFKTLFEKQPALVLVLNSVFVITAVSDAYCAATKTKREEILGRHIFDVFPDNPNDPNADGVQKLNESLTRALKNKKPDPMAIQKYDIRRPEEEGGGFEERFWSPINVPICNELGQVTTIIHQAEDVTEFVKLKKTKDLAIKNTDSLKRRILKSEMEVFVRAQEIARVRDELQSELESGQKDLVTLARELKASKDEALKASKVKSQFLANMSHEIRTPLGIILGFTDLLKDASLSWSERENFIDRIRKSGRHLLELLSEILDLTKIEAGQLDVECENLSIQGLLGSVISLLEPVAQKKGLNLKLEKVENLPKTLVTDPTKIRQILINLVSNAIKFTRTGTVTLKVDMNPIVDPAEVQFLVKDTGPGIPESYMKRLFEEFSQADSSMTRTHGGSGLGLALSRKLAHILGGDLRLLETSSKGTTFMVRVPMMASDNVLSIHKKRPGANANLEDANILLVDDAPDNLYLVRHILERAGAKVETASNGQEGYDKAIAGEFDLVIMDLQMPLLNGYEATSRLRSHGFKKPIVALTAHAMKEDRDKCIDVGCNDYLSKPIVKPLLLSTIQKNLRSSVSISRFH